MNHVQQLFLAVNWRLRSALGLPYGNESEMIYRLNRLPESGAPGQKFRFPWGQVEYRSAGNLCGQYSEIFVDRQYAVRSSNPEPVIIDAGGNIGMSAIWFKRAYPKSRLTVYEADPQLSTLLVQNLAMAGITDVTVHNAAVWIEDGYITFDNAGQDKGAVSPAGAIQVPSVDLAVHLPERVDLLKLDIEGAEYSVLEKLCATGSISRVQNLVAEFHILRDDIDRVIALLGQLREAGMQVAITSVLGPWLGSAKMAAPFEKVDRLQTLAEVYAWR